ncbi:hypothetical protein K8S19_01900 [bacterium]|nr:hypothetical protein [bacterium]
MKNKLLRKTDRKFSGKFQLYSGAERFLAVFIMGLLLLGSGTSLFAATADQSKVLPRILQQLETEGKKVLSSSAMEKNSETIITVVLGNKEVRKYDGGGQMIERKDARGRITQYEDGQPVKERNASGTVIAEYEYLRDKTGNIQKMVKKGLTGVEIKIYDRKGNVIQASNTQGIHTYSNYVKNNKGKTVSFIERNMNDNKMYKVILDPKTGNEITKIDNNGIRIDISHKFDLNGEKTETVERDSAGNVIIKRFSQGQVVEEEKNGLLTKFETISDENGVMKQRIEYKQQPSATGMVTEKIVRDYDNVGRVLRKEDQTSISSYSYEVGANGQVVARHEVIQYKDKNKAQRNITTRYDAVGRITAIKEKNKNIQYKHILDELGNLVTTLEFVDIRINGQSFSDIIRKEFNETGQVVSKRDGNGLQTRYAYDSVGNKIKSETELETTKYFYDGSHRMIASETTDYRSWTLTVYDVKTKKAKNKIRITNSGVIEFTVFGINPEGKRYSVTTEAFAIRYTIDRDAESEQPEKVILIKFNGRQIITDYSYIGDQLISSHESSLGGITDIVYNLKGKPSSAVTVNQWGVRSTTIYQYGNGRMKQSVQEDYKGKTITLLNKYEDPYKITRINSIGFPRRSEETRIYKNGMLTESISTDVKGCSYTYYNEHEKTDSIHRVNEHGFPRKNRVFHQYDDGGDLIRTIQRDNRGITRNEMDEDGLTGLTVRLDRFGFPKRKTTTYLYKKGELISSLTKDKRGEAHNTFDVDGLMRKSLRKKIFGYPRLEATRYEYDYNGYMTYSLGNDANGFTQNYYDIDELVACSYRENRFGHAREQWTINEYDAQGFLRISKEFDLRGVTLTEYDRDNLATCNFRYDVFGLEYARETFTVNHYDEQGFLIKSLSKNLLSTSEKNFDRDSLVQLVDQHDNFGVIDGRHKISDNYIYNELGRIQSNRTLDDLGTTFSSYDIHGDAVETLRVASLGIGASRKTYTWSGFHADTGMTTARNSFNEGGITQSMEFDPITGLEKRQLSKNTFGLRATCLTETFLEMDPRHGLSRSSRAENAYAVTTTDYDAKINNGPYGIAVRSRTQNKFGLTYTRDTVTAIEADIHTGLNRRTKAENRYSTTLTEYDALSQGRHGVAVKSYTANYFGIDATRKTATDIKTNLWNGLNRETVAKNAFSTTHTNYESAHTGVSTDSMSWNNFGLGANQETYTEIVANQWNGLNRNTTATTAYGKTETVYDARKYGVALTSNTENLYGLFSSRSTQTLIFANTGNGLNEKTIAVNNYSEAVTFFDSQDTGLARTSITRNHYGLGATRITVTEMYTNRWNGLNQYTVARNDYSKTTTRFDHVKTGVAVESLAENFYGLFASRETYTRIKADSWNGLNEETVAVNAYGSTWTRYDHLQTGVATQSRAWNNYGLHATRLTRTQILADHYNGLNKKTVAKNDHSETVTLYDHAGSGVALSSLTTNVYGLGAAQVTRTKVTADTWNGLNRQTVADNHYGRTVTVYDHEQTGKALRSTANNYFGLGATRKTMTKITASAWNGLNLQTEAVSAYGKTLTYFDGEDTGVSVMSEALNNFGLASARKVKTAITANTKNGLNQKTEAVSAYNRTLTRYDDQKSGVALESDTWNNFGLGATLESHSKIRTNLWNGLNEMTVARSHYAVTVTQYDSHATGCAFSSDTFNRFGLGANAESHTDITANTWNGLNRKTVAITESSKTITTYDDRVSGVATESDTSAVFGLGANAETHTDIVAGAWNGLNIETIAVNAYGITTTEYDQALTGVAEKTTVKTNYGLYAARETETVIGANTWNGLNRTTKAVNAYSITLTTYDDKQSGVALYSLAENKFGLFATRTTETKIEANRHSGLNISTEATNAYGKTYTRYDDQATGMALWSRAWNNFGLKASRTTDTSIIADEFNGLNKMTIAMNEYGKTYTIYDAEKTGVAQLTLAENNFGIGATRETATVITADLFNGLNRETVSKNKHSETTTQFDADNTGVALSSQSRSNFGLGANQMTRTKIDAGEWNGLNKMTRAENAYGTVTTLFDSEKTGVAKMSRAENNFGLFSTRLSDTEINANDWNGLNTSTIASTHYGITTTYYDDEVYGCAEYSVAVNAYGLLGAKITTSNITANTWTGLNAQTVVSNENSTTVTLYDDEHSGTATTAMATNHFGLEGARETISTITADRWNGLNKETRAVNRNSMVTTYYDDEETGVARLSQTINNYGVGAAESTETQIETDLWTGLNIRTIAVNAYGETETKYDHEHTGVATFSRSRNQFGIGAARVTETVITANLKNGLNRRTKAQNSSGTTWTYYDDARTGSALRSHTESNFGAFSSRTVETTIVANRENGLNKVTTAISDYSTSVTFFDDTYTGLPQFSRTSNNFGLGATAETDTLIQGNAWTGLNCRTTAMNAYGTTVTKYDDEKTGLSQSTEAWNHFGILYTRETATIIEADGWNGLTKKTIADNQYSTTTTLFDSQDTGLPVYSHGKNKFGLLDSRENRTYIQTNTYTGLNKTTVAINGLSTVTSHYDDAKTGLVQYSHAENVYGIGAARSTVSVNDTNAWNGLNRSTLTVNDAGTSTTYYDHEETGTAVASLAENNFGIYGARATRSAITANIATGLNEVVVAENDNNIIITRHDGGDSGVAVSSISYAKFGLIGARETQTAIEADRSTGLNCRTTAVNELNTTVTYFDDQATGLPQQSETTSHYGLLSTRTTLTDILSNTWTGLNKTTVTDNDYTTTVTTFDEWDTGVPLESRDRNKYGLLSTRDTHTRIETDLNTGMNTKIVSTNGQGSTTTYYEDREHGVPTSSRSESRYGVWGSRMTHTRMKANVKTGINIETLATNSLSETTTWYDQTYGTAMRSYSKNYYGTLASRSSETDITADKTTGLSILTVAKSAFGTTTTQYDHLGTGTAFQSDTAGNFGILYSRNASTQIFADDFSGMSTKTIATSQYGTTTSFYDANYGTMTKSVANNLYGAKDSREVTNYYRVNLRTGINLSSVAFTETGKNKMYYDRDGITTKTISENKFGAEYARKTETRVTADRITGQNLVTVATNRMGRTTSYFDRHYGVVERQVTESYYGPKGGRQSNTLVDADRNTGLNKSTFSYSDLSQTWTRYHSETGAQTESTVLLNRQYNLGCVQVTKNTFQTRDNGLLSSSTAINGMGITQTDYTDNGFAATSTTYSNVGLAYMTVTSIAVNKNTGLNKTTVAKSYSRKDKRSLVTTTTTRHNRNGFAVEMLTENHYGAYKGRSNVTYYIQTNAYSGIKERTKSRNGLGRSETFFNEKGVETKTISRSYLGPRYGRKTDIYTAEWDGATGMKRKTYSENPMTKIWQYYNEHGLPASYQKDVYNNYAAGTGDRISHVTTGPLHWSGIPSETLSTTLIGSNRNYADKNGFVTHSYSTRDFGENGSQRTWATYNVNKSTGLNSSSRTYKCNGRGHTRTSFDGNGMAVKGASWSPKKNKSIFSQYTKSRFENYNNPDTGIPYWSASFDDDGSKITSRSPSRVGWTCHSFVTVKWNDYKGRPYYGYTHKAYSSGSGKNEKKKWRKWRSYYQTYSLTGLMKRERRVPVKNCKFDEKIVYYDQDGVEKKSATAAYDEPVAEQEQWTYYNYHNKELNSKVVRYGDIKTVEQLELSEYGKDGAKEHFPSIVRVIFHQALYVTEMLIVYAVTPDGPYSATVTDNQGTELWVLNGDYHQADTVRRYRTSYGGATTLWVYTSTPEGRYHTAADITYTDLWGLHNGHGQEYYTETGILNKQVLSNMNSWDETITYYNDGQFVTSAAGLREDGQTTLYTFVGMNDIASSQDDKGMTVWNPGTHKRDRTQGGMGTFVYTYSGDRMEKIDGVAVDGTTMTLDAYWNLQTWTDSRGVVHTYSPTTSVKSYWTGAIERFTDTAGNQWVGEVSYDTSGFYYTGSQLKSLGADVSQSNADNTVALNGQTAIDFIKQLLKQKYTEKETSGGHSTLGEKMAEALTQSDLDMIADVEIDIQTDGSTLSRFNNIRFTQTLFTKEVLTEGKKETVMTSEWSRQSPQKYDSYNSDNYNNPQFVGHCGYSYDIETRLVTDPESGQQHTEYRYLQFAYSREYLGFAWVKTGTKDNQFFSETLTLNTNTVVAGPIGGKDKSIGVQAASVQTNRRQHTFNRNPKGVVLGGGSLIPADKAEPASVGSKALKMSAAIPELADEQAVKGAVVSTQMDAPEKEKTVKRKISLNSVGVREVRKAMLAILRQMDLTKIRESILDELEASNMQPLINVMQSIFGKEYKASWLSQVTEFLLNNGRMLEDLKVALTGEAIPQETKKALTMAKELQSEKNVKRDEKGRVLDVVDRRGVRHEFVYETSGVTEKTSGGGSTACIKHYDLEGRLLSETEGGVNKVYDYEYTAKGEISKVYVAQRSEDGLAQSEYDAQGRLILLAQGDQTRTYHYTGQGTDVYTVVLYGEQGSILEERDYRSGMLTCRRQLDGSTTRYHYSKNKSGKISEIHQEIEARNGDKHYMKYDQTGRLIARGKKREKLEKIAKKDSFAEQALDFSSQENGLADPRMERMKMDHRRFQLQQ